MNTLSTAQKANFTQITGIALGGSTTTPAKGTPPSKSMLESPVVADIANWWRRADFSLIREAHAVDSGGAGIFALVVDLGFAQFSWLSEEAAGSGIDTSRGLYRIDFGPIHAVFASS